MSLELLKAQTDVVAPCGCRYRFSYVDGRWFNAGIGPASQRHDNEWARRLKDVRPEWVSAGHAIAASQRRGKP